MPPKAKVTKDDILNTAVQIVRKNGAGMLNARTVAEAMKCSTQPIFSNFASMEELKLAVVAKADEIYEEYRKRETERGEYPAYKAAGMAYIRFAKEEKELFKLLYMRNRKWEEGEPSAQVGAEMNQMVQSNTGLSPEDATLFHLEMWACVHGIAVMFATQFVDLDWDLTSRMLTDCYRGLRKQYGMED